MLVFYTGLLYYYLGPILFILYFLIVLQSLSVKHSAGDVLFIILLLFFFSCRMYVFSLYDVIYQARFYWGFLAFYLYFKRESNISFERLLLILCFLTLLEAILVNTIVDPKILPNYPSPETALGHFATDGQYQRPYSFGGSASVTASFLVVVLSCINRSGFFKIGLVALTLTAVRSGSGYIAFLLYIFSKARYKIVLVASMLILWFAIEVPTTSFLYRITFPYIKHLVLLKLNQINYIYTNADWVDVLIGGMVPIGGDFALLSFFGSQGITGILLLLGFFALKLNKKNAIPIMLLWVSSMHYSFMFYFPGQILTGYVLNMEAHKRSV